MQSTKKSFCVAGIELNSHGRQHFFSWQISKKSARPIRFQSHQFVFGMMMGEHHQTVPYDSHQQPQPSFSILCMCANEPRKLHIPIPLKYFPFSIPRQWVSESDWNCIFLQGFPVTTADSQDSNLILLLFRLGNCLLRIFFSFSQWL